ncbi:hypothetical protein IAD21_02646 [Abditibacteriota bacterium]|nr:hypothetical protein IAD21_02646 [Abditibacteriota bacterium]
MPAAARRHPEPELEPTPVAADWEHYSSYIDRYSGHRDEYERQRIKMRLRRHKRFYVSSLFIVSTLLTFELIALVWLGSVTLVSYRQSDQLSRDIKETSRLIALTQDRIAAQNAAPSLNQWAGQLGYRKFNPAFDADRVNSDAPMPAPTAKANSR